MFTGCYTAIITPFKTDGSIDWDKFRELIDRQTQAGIDGIVPVGTTGESPSLSYKEHIKVVETAVDACKGQMKVIAGTGANSTSEAIELTRHALDAGADGTLQVTPYYNKPSQEGLFQHFSAIADLGLPVVIYNVPGRSSRSVDIETIVKLSKHDNVVAVKEAAGSVDRVSAILTNCDITVLSGDDSLALPMISVGAKGVISVASNVTPEPVTKMIHSAMDGQWDKARDLHMKYYKLFTDLFIETNPVPVKAAMAMMNLSEEVYRLPLCPMTDQQKEQLQKTLKALELI